SPMFELQSTNTLQATLDSGTLRIVDTTAADTDNQLTVQRSGTNLVIHDASGQFISAPAGGTLSDYDQTLTIPFASVTALDFDLLAGNDQLTVDFTGDDPIPAGGLNIDGGVGSNSLHLVNGNFSTITSTFLGLTSGTLDLDGAEITHDR